MKRYRNILVPVDGSELSMDAFEQAMSLSKLIGSKITVLHVMEQLYSDYTVLEGAEIISASNIIQTETRQQVKNFLEDFVRRGGEEGVDVRTLIKDGHVAQEIIELSGQYDLIIIGTHGRRKITSLIMGSVAEKVGRHALCPVMLVRDPKKDA
ncbi:MAG: universal stress protein [Candidatus Thermoplasmatota archaeon]|nr:universal stress protein [Candidatus Thermoplasmatota archaeon]